MPEYVNNVTDSTKIVLLLVQESISRGSLDGIDSNFFLLNEHDNRHSTTLSTWPSFAKYIKGDWNNTATLYLNVPIFQPRCFCMPAEGDCTPLPVTREEAEDLGIPPSAKHGVSENIHVFFFVSDIQLHLGRGGVAAPAGMLLV